MRPSCLLALTIFITISLHAQTSSEEEEVEPPPYGYDTTLKGGYSLSYKADDSLQYLYLKKGKKTITELSCVSLGMLNKNLGYIGADFTSYFVFVHSFGGGNPHYIELIKKATGKNILNNGAAWIDVEEKKELLLYCKNDGPDKNDKMILLNVRTGQKQYFSFPKELFEESMVLNRIQISKVTDTQLVITYDTKNGSKVKMYKR
ncbi:MULTISPECIES: hypothetical protein [Niastella]|uniref:Peptidase S9A N-terminal domain-containing protein n=1 Tax=Niastella soli TaxID=2821487 RepID=A0ABS3Z703_9BACT|nr:hypothetical protein [Niastella soli]MBO9205465.1 hypothetical protein [Niastella soli]